MAQAQEDVALTGGGAAATEGSAPEAAGAEADVLASDVSVLSGSPDPENCLSCHRFRGLSRLDDETGELRLFFCDAGYFAHQEGPHARLRCTACHLKEEFEEIPHEPKTPVDCTRTCHLVPSSGVELTFSHQAVADIVAESVHRPEKLDGLEWARPLLREGQSDCLYCHDQPVFREVQLTRRTHRGFDATARCDTCHGDELPVQVDYTMKHVVSRLQSARPVRQLVQVCAVCHADPAIVEQMESHDAVASYLHSFHGKASLLGSESTATCVDCHAHESGNVHLMLAHDDADATTNPAVVGDTCRSSDCHPEAPPGISSAAVHLRIDPTARTVEFWVASFFVLLTAGVMSLYFLLIILELFSSAFRREDREHHRMVRLARRLLALPEGRALLARMDLHQRVQHWALAVFFLVLVFTGLPIKFADEPWAASLVSLAGGLSVTRGLHRIAGVILCVTFGYHLVYVTIKCFPRIMAALRRPSLRGLVELTFSYPMMPNWRDVKEFAQLFAYLLFLRRERPRHPQYHFSEKFEYMAVFWGMLIIGFSGVALWVGPMVAEVLPGWVLNFAFIVHSDEAYLAFIYIAVVHMFSVILAPTVFPLSLGTLSGDAPARELAEGHAGVLLEVAEKLGVTQDEEGDVPPGGLLRLLGSGVRRAYALSLLVVVAVVCVSSLGFLGRLLLTRPMAPAEIREIPRVLDATALVAPVEAGEVTPEDEEARVQTRGPLAHFHKVPVWYVSDPGNSCTTSGCHALLPHGERVETRAFLNMHTTFVDCMTCHQEDADAAEHIGWVRLADRAEREPPAILRLASELERMAIEGFGDREDASRVLETLLMEAVEDAGEQSELRHWLVELQTTHPSSRTWKHLVEEIQLGLPLHEHGEYSAKLGRVDAVGLPRAASPDREAATRQLLREAGTFGEDEEHRLQDLVHVGVADEGYRCTPCHGLEDTVVSFHGLGYPPTRVRELESNAVIRQALDIEEGESFFLPLILDGSHGQ